MFWIQLVYGLLLVITGFSLAKLIQVIKIRKVLGKTGLLIEKGELELRLIPQTKDTDTVEQKAEIINKLMENREQLGIVMGRIEAISELHS